MALTGRVALVTGAGRGIGRVAALALAREGARVGLVSRTEAEVDAVAMEIVAAGGDALALRADVSREDDVAAVARTVAERSGALHVLVNNAALRMDHIGGGPGYPYRIALADVAIADFDRMIATNVRGPYLTCKLLAPLLRAAAGASVVNISAGAGVRGQAGRAPYSASKFALEGMTQALAEEWRADRIAVNTLEPGGSVLTDATKGRLVESGVERRFLRPDVIVPALLALATPAAGGVTGTHVDALEWAVAHGLGPRERWLV